MFRNVPECSGMFRDVPGCSGMFRNVPGCSGMFHVPGFIDGLQKLHEVKYKVKLQKVDYKSELLYTKSQRCKMLFTSRVNTILLQDK